MSADAARRPRPVGEDVIVALYRPADLLSVQPEAMLERDARIEPGADEIVSELLGRSRVQRRAHIVVTLPAEQITDGIAETLHVALRRYCEARLARVQRETELAWRQGVRSLGSGSILFVVGLLLSAGFLEPDVPEFWQNLLGNGVFLVKWCAMGPGFEQPVKHLGVVMATSASRPFPSATVYARLVLCIAGVCSSSDCVGYASTRNTSVSGSTPSFAIARLTAGPNARGVAREL